MRSSQVDLSRVTAAGTTEDRLVRPAPVLAVAVRFLPLWLVWLLVVVLGRRVCRVAQRIPPVVRLVRRLRAAGPPTLPAGG